jgi:cobyrinic acid a,c-diamide synthase
VVARLVVAAPASGSGKTTVATGLMAAFASSGLAVSPHKVGPDYIDPGYHALATGRPGRNLDAYMCGTEAMAPLFAHGAAGCELAVIEGVMGLFDGASAGATGVPGGGRGAGAGELASTAQIARLLSAPVVLVVDASSQSRSVAALVHGFVSWDPGVRIGGVILNKVGSDRHEELLRDALEDTGVPVMGVLRRGAAVVTPSRHLGLIPVAERHREAVDSVAAMAELVRSGCDLGALLALARSAPPLGAEPWSPYAGVAGGAPGAEVTGSGGAESSRAGADAGGTDAVRGGRGPGAGPVIALAAGPAFTFAYAEHRELLAAYGAEVVPFDPLRDERLPDSTAGVIIGGGFPEMYAPELAANEPLRKHMVEFARAGGPVAAECAGLLYLARTLDGQPMCGVLDADARMGARLTLGYREAVALGESCLAVAGTRLRGHEFHRTSVEPGAGRSPAWGMVRPERRTEGFVEGGVHASYLHTHWAADPGVARRFTEESRRWAAG